MADRSIIQKEDLEKLINKGYTITAISKELNFSRKAISKSLRKYGLRTNNMEKLIYCKCCGKKLINNQRFYCSKNCKIKWFGLQSNQKPNDNKVDSNLSYSADRGRRKKFSILKERGMKCEKCGYNKNLAALCFHHINENEKSFNLGSREFASMSMETLRNEIDKCQILCHNCHMELHYSDWNKERMETLYS